MREIRQSGSGGGAGSNFPAPTSSRLRAAPSAVIQQAARGVSWSRGQIRGRAALLPVLKRSLLNLFLCFAGLAPAADDPRRRVYLQWMFHLDNMVQPLFRIWWYPHEVAGADLSETALAHVQPRIEATWARIDAHLAAHGPYLLGPAPCVADFYLTMLMRWSRKMPRPATEWPHLAALAASLKSRPSFAALYAAEGLEEWA